jgi:hypothetical protein
VACVVNAAADQLQADLRFQRQAGSVYACLLQKNLGLLKEAAATAQRCVDDSGFGETLRRCTETKDCVCASHSARRLRQQQEWLSQRIREILAVIGEAREDLDFVALLRAELDKADYVRRLCASRAKLLDEMLAWHEARLAEDQPKDAGHEAQTSCKEAHRAEKQQEAWASHLEVCTKADSDTSHAILKHIRSYFGHEAVAEARRCYTEKLLSWYSGKKFFLVDGEGRFLRLRRPVCQSKA